MVKRFLEILILSFFTSVRECCMIIMDKCKQLKPKEDLHDEKVLIICTCSVAPQWAKKSFINAVVQNVDFSYPVLWQNTAFGHLPCEDEKFSTMQKGQTTRATAFTYIYAVIIVTAEFLFRNFIKINL